MNQICIFKNDCLEHKYCEGYSAKRILEETCPDVSLEMCILKAGHSRKFEVYSRLDKMQIFTFTAGTGTVKSNNKIYFIDDLTSCMDDVNMLSFLDLLKYLLKDKEGPIDQLFFVTCDDRIERLLCYKMEGCDIPYIKLSEKNFPKY